MEEFSGLADAAAPFVNPRGGVYAYGTAGFRALSVFALYFAFLSVFALYFAFFLIYPSLSHPRARSLSLSLPPHLSILTRAKPCRPL